MTGWIKIKIKQIHLTYCLQPIRFTSPPTITMPRQTNNKKQSTSQAQEDIPASTAKTDECLSTEDKNLIEDQQKTIDKLMKWIITLEGKFHELEGRLLITQTVNHHLESMMIHWGNILVDHAWWLTEWRSLETKMMMRSLLFPSWRKKLELMRMSFNKTSIKFTWLVNLKIANSTEL